MTYQDAVASLDTFVNYERQHAAEAMRQVKLDRMRRLCQRLGDPQRRFRSVLVAGTNGKGSICAMLYSMLRESTLRVGLYTSPHVEHLRERIRMWSRGPRPDERAHGDDWIPEADFAAVIESLMPSLEAMHAQSSEGPPTYFEVMTAAAFVYFSRRKVDVAVIEVGLGGRSDATNVVEQAVSVFGPIDLDHVDVLGADAAAIAAEKAGIIKPRQLVISAPQQPDVLTVLQASCEAQGVPLLVVGRDITVRINEHDLDGLQVSVTSLRGIYESLDIPLIGRHQAENAAAAVCALEALSSTGVPRAMVEQGLARVEWPGRLEAVHESPLVLMDGGHNPHAVEALRQALEEFGVGRRIHLLIGVSSDKPVEAIGRRLGGLSVSATCTASRHPRALSPTALAKRLAPFCADVHVMSDPIDAYTYLLNAASPEEIIVVMGSLFLVGELRAALRQSHVRPRRRPATATP